LNKKGGDIDRTDIIGFHSGLHQKYGKIVKYGVLSKPEVKLN
jgi:hypothetical protein